MGRGGRGRLGGGQGEGGLARAGGADVAPRACLGSGSRGRQMLVSSSLTWQTKAWAGQAGHGTGLASEILFLSKGRKVRGGWHDQNQGVSGLTEELRQRGTGRSRSPVCTDMQT